ncbi:MAG: hypothetical protein H6566_25775 [Lewinellaceae bacterium]|nr:hypothetical protein [Lewinellaceae bacterium]
MSRIQIHQAFYGEVNRAHSRIHQTIDDPELTSFLIRFTDRPGALTPGVELKPYLSGSSFGDYYIFTKTFPDPFASRSGMVITHCLITEINSLREINYLADVYKHFISQVPEVRNNLTPLEINLESSDLTDEIEQPIYIQKALSAFIKGNLPILFTGQLDSFATVLQKLWNSPTKALRETIKFRVSFAPADISDSNDLTIVLIQDELLAKWQSSDIINDNEQTLIEITSHSEALFLGNQKENPFYIFLESLDANLNDINTYVQGDLLYTDFVSLENLKDTDVLRRDIRILTKLSPNRNSGKSIKSRFIEKLKEFVVSGIETNAKGLRNIQWHSFDKGEEIGKTLVAGIIENSLNDSKHQHTEKLAEIAQLSVNEPNKNWWHLAVEKAFKANTSRDKAVIQKSIWRLLLYSKKCLKNISSFLSSDEAAESILRKYLPVDIKPENGKDILPILQKRKWYLLHAEILLKIYSLPKVIEQQLVIEKSLPFEDSIGVKYILRKTSDAKLLTITLESCNEKLITELTDRILKNETLLKKIDLNVSCWLNIWTAVLGKKQNFQYGIKGKEVTIVCCVLDLASDGNTIQHLVFDLIAKTEFSDISSYKNRYNVWEFIPISSRDRFIESTTKSVVQNLLQDEIEASSIEPVLKDQITSTRFMSSFLSLYKSNIDPVLKIFESFPNLPDNFLSDYIYYYKSQITKNQSRRLGSLILSRNYATSARNVYDKSRYYISFTLAYELCKDLVKLNWWESIWPTPVQKQTSNYYNMEESKKTKLTPIESLPTIVILTAIQEEYIAVKSFLKEVVEADRDDTTYEVGIFNLYDKDIAKVIIRECGAKNTIASQETERAIRNFQPSAIFFVGIAGSRKPNDFSLGDVIFPEKIYSYEGGKSEKETFSTRPDLAGTTFTLNEIAKKERRKNDWKAIIKNGWPTEVKANLGVIASGEKLIEHYESDIGRILTEHYNDTSAVEMEGFGFAKAATRQGRSASQMMIGVVRGISDIIEQPNEKKKGKESDRRPDNAKQFASDTAAAFTYWLIFKAFP